MRDRVSDATKAKACHADPSLVTCRGIKLKGLKGLAIKIKELGNTCLTSREDLSSDSQRPHKNSGMGVHILIPALEMRGQANP